MKVLKVRFANLNALYGEWEIDLATPAIAQSGLFVISGPTGAGKTTILDAISLALYGRTARVGDLSKSSNEVMSRRARTCFSEVTFEARGARYRCRWSQSRTQRRGGAGEGLAQIERSLAEDATGAILAEKSRETGALIQSLTGLSFEQFCSTVLLAQGRFAAFLEAREGERSAILEQMTQTERFGALSMAVHERHREEQRVGDNLKAQLSGLTPLSPEEVEGHGAALRALAARAGALAHAQQSVLAQLQWLATVDRLGQEAAACQAALSAQRAASARFEPERRALEAAERARSARPLRQQLEALRAAQRADCARRDQAIGERQRWAREVEEAAQRALRAQEALERARATRERLRPDIDRAIELDERIEHRRQAARAAEGELLDRRERAGQVSQALRQSAEALAAQRAALEGALAYLESHAADAALVAQLEGLCQRFEHLDRSEAALRAQQAQHAAARQALEQAARAHGEACVQCERAQAALVEERTGADRLRGALGDLLGQQPLCQWIERRAALRGALKAVEQAQRDLGERDALSAQIEALLATIASLDAGAPERQEALARARTHHEAMAAEGAALGEALHRAQRCQSYASARLSLAEGVPCPLCGATKHPWAGEAALAPEALAAEEAALSQAIAAQRQERLRPAREAVEALIAANADAEARRREADGRRTDLIHRRASLDSALRTAVREFSAGSDLPSTGAAELLAHRGEIEAALAEIGAAVERAQEIERQLEAQAGQLEAQADEVRRAEDRAHRAELAQAQAQAQHADRQALVQRARADFEALAAGLAQALRPYALQLPSDAVARAQVRHALAERRDRWQAQREGALAAEQNLALLTQKREALAAQRAEMAQALGEAEAALNVRRAELGAVLGARQALLDGRPHAEVSRDLAEAIEAAEAFCGRGRGELEVARLNFERAGQRLEELDARGRERAEEIDAAARALGDRLDALGFDGEADCRDAELSDERFGDLQCRREALDAALGEAEVRQAAKQRELAAEQAKALAQETTAALEARHQALSDELGEVQQEIGRRQGLLDDDAAVRRRNAALAEQIERQDAQVRRWARLDALIGSHDGKNFRNFAQGLTLDRLIALANAPLQALTGRYALCRARQEGSAEPTLALAVIDRDQGGALRSVSNLSGGESFLVSLALALGLSRMAGERVRIDSLFLDEGFGTLDENALAMVIGALSRLRHEGKTIGIISHVPQLREVEPRIEVERMRGGRSRLSGPGCREVEPFSPALPARRQRKSARKADAAGAPADPGRDQGEKVRGAG